MSTSAACCWDATSPYEKQWSRLLWCMAGWWNSSSDIRGKTRTSTCLLKFYIWLPLLKIYIWLPLLKNLLMAAVFAMLWLYKAFNGDGGKNSDLSFSVFLFFWWCYCFKCSFFWWLTTGKSCNTSSMVINLASEMRWKDNIFTSPYYPPPHTHAYIHSQTHSQTQLKEKKGGLVDSSPYLSIYNQMECRHWL